MRTAPGPGEGGYYSAAVGSSPPEPGMRIASDSSGDGRTFAAIASPPREPGVRKTLGPRVDDTSRIVSSSSSTTSSFEGATTSRRDSQSVRVPLVCGYSNTGLHARPVGTPHCSLLPKKVGMLSDPTHITTSARCGIVLRPPASRRRPMSTWKTGVSRRATSAPHRAYPPLCPRHASAPLLTQTSRDEKR